MWHGCTPPVFTPISERAIAHFDRPEGIDGVMFIDDPEVVLSSFPDDFILVSGDIDETPGVICIAILAQEALH